MRRLIIALCSLPLFTGTIRAGADIAEQTVPLMTAVQQEPVNMIVPIYRAFITVGGDKFTFIIPEGFRLGGDPGHGRLRIENEGGGTTITFTILGSMTAQGELRPEPFRELLSHRHPNGKFIGQFIGSGASASGPGLDMEWRSETGFVQRTRAVYLPTVAGVLEVTVTSGANKFKEAQDSFSRLTQTLCVSVDGKLTYCHLSDRSEESGFDIGLSYPSAVPAR